MRKKKLTVRSLQDFHRNIGRPASPTGRDVPEANDDEAASSRKRAG
jgi:hypothetical protein